LAVISALFAGVLILLSLPVAASSFAPAEAKQSQQVAAGGFLGIFCSQQVGDFIMDSRYGWFNPLAGYPNPEQTNRKWTLQEAFGGNAVVFPTYHGEGGANEPFVAEKNFGKDDKGEPIVAPDPDPRAEYGNYAEVSGKLEGARNLGNCTLLSLYNESLTGAFLLPTTIVVTFTSGIVNFAFNPSLICKDPANPDGNCFNLVGILGGVNNTPGEGIIGTLTSSIYLPLLVIAVTIAALWVAYTGLVKRKFREALFGALWVVLSVIFGLIALYNPTLLAKAPMAVSNAVSSCVIGAFSGVNCMSGAGGGDAIVDQDIESGTSGEVCTVRTDNLVLDQQMSAIMNGLTCNIWKAFVLEPYSQANFGASFEELDTITGDKITPVLEKAGIDGATYCINMGSSQPARDQVGQQLKLDGGKQICNMAAYQMYLLTNADAGDGGPPATGTDYRWYNIVVPAANDDGLWGVWSPSIAASFGKMTVAGLGLFSAVLGSAILITTAAFALIYYVSAVILMALAPIFLLFGVHPSRGKKLMLGWFEKVISNVLKYLASAVFLLVAVAFYAAILANATNVGLTLIFVLLISGALFLNRREIVNLIGKVNMGGEQMTSNIAERLGGSAKAAGGLALAGVGGGLGAALAGGSVASGLKDGLKRDLKRGSANRILGGTAGTVVTEATRQFERDTVDRRRDIKTDMRNQHADNVAAETQAQSRGDELQAATADHGEFDAKLDDLGGRGPALEEKVELNGRILTDEVHRIEVSGNAFMDAQQMLNTADALKVERDNAVAAGNPVKAAAITQEIRALESDAARTLGEVPADRRHELMGDYHSQFEARRKVREKELGRRIMPGDEEFTKLGDETLASMRSTVNAFARIQHGENALADLRGQRSMAEAAGDNASTARLDLEIGEKKAEIESFKASLETPKGQPSVLPGVTKLQTDFKKSSDTELTRNNAHVTEDTFKGIVHHRETLAKAATTIEDMRENELRLHGEKWEAKVKAAETKAAEDYLTKIDREWQPGDAVTSRKMAAHNEEIERLKDSARGSLVAEQAAERKAIDDRYSDSLSRYNAAREEKASIQRDASDAPASSPIATPAPSAAPTGLPTIPPLRPEATPSRPTNGDDDTPPPSSPPAGGGVPPKPKAPLPSFGPAAVASAAETAKAATAATASEPPQGARSASEGAPLTGSAEQSATRRARAAAVSSEPLQTPPPQDAQSPVTLPKAGTLPQRPAVTPATTPEPAETPTIPAQSPTSAPQVVPRSHTAEQPSSGQSYGEAASSEPRQAFPAQEPQSSVAPQKAGTLPQRPAAPAVTPEPVKVPEAATQSPTSAPQAVSRSRKAEQPTTSSAPLEAPSPEPLQPAPAHTPEPSASPTRTGTLPPRPATRVAPQKPAEAQETAPTIAPQTPSGQTSAQPTVTPVLPAQPAPAQSVPTPPIRHEVPPPVVPVSDAPPTAKPVGVPTTPATAAKPTRSEAPVRSEVDSRSDRRTYTTPVADEKLQRPSPVAPQNPRQATVRPAAPSASTAPPTAADIRNQSLSSLMSNAMYEGTQPQKYPSMQEFSSAVAAGQVSDDVLNGWATGQVGNPGAQEAVDAILLRGINGQE
jgi:hypothetical protein